jgi:hypothetical protein
MKQIDRVAEAVQEGTETDTDISFVVSDVRSVIASKDTPEQATQEGDDRSSPRYTDTRLTDDAVVTMENWLDNEYLHAVSNDDVLAHLDEILLLLIAARGEACGTELRQDLRACSARISVRARCIRI